MKKVILLFALILLISCNKDKKIISPEEEIEENDTIQTCVFSNYNINYIYVFTIDNNDNIVDIFKNTQFDNYPNNQKYLSFKITTEPLRDTTDRYLSTSIKSACNSTGREYDIENCGFTARTDFFTTKVYCGGLDEYLLERITGNIIIKQVADTIVVYEKENGWYHYFIVNQKEEEKDDEKTDTLPKIKISLNQIYAKDDTLKIPLNINYLKNDTTKCFVNGVEVEAYYIDYESSYIIMPQINFGQNDENMKHQVTFTSITNQDTIIEISKIIYFKDYLFNNSKITLENINLVMQKSQSSSHPSSGSSSKADTLYHSSFDLYVKYNKSTPQAGPTIHFPLRFAFNGNTLNWIKNFYLYYSMDGLSGNKNIEVANLNFQLLPNKNQYEIIITDKNFIDSNVKLDYFTDYRNSGSSTSISESLKILSYSTTESTILKIEFYRD